MYEGFGAVIAMWLVIIVIILIYAPSIIKDEFNQIEECLNTKPG